MTDEKKRFSCPSCRSSKTVRNGWHKATGAQKLMCRNCGRSFQSAYCYTGVKVAPRIKARLHAPPWESTRKVKGRLDLMPIRLEEANAFVRRHHRHHGPVVGHVFSIGVTNGTELLGVVIVGRPVARHLDDGHSAEVTRCCTTGTSNAVSMLYGAARRAAFALGYKRIITYTLAREHGASLRAAGW